MMPQRAASLRRQLRQSTIDMFCRSARLLKLFTLLGVDAMTRGLRLARDRIRVESNRSGRFPPDVLPGCITCARSRHDIGKDQRHSMDGDNRQAVSCPVNVFDRKCGRGKAHGSTLSIALVLHCLSRERLCAIQVNGQIGCARQRARPERNRQSISFHFACIASPPLRACSYHEVLRLFRSRIVNPVQFIGMNERRGSGPDHRRLTLNGHRDGALHQQKEFLVLVAVGRMRLASRSKCGLVNFKVLPGVGHAVEDRPGFVLPILLYRQVAIRLDEGAECRAVRMRMPKTAASMGIACRRERRVAFIESPCDRIRQRLL